MKMRKWLVASILLAMSIVYGFAEPQRGHLINLVGTNEDNYENFFRESCMESMVFIYPDRMAYIFTTEQEHAVGLPLMALIEVMKKSGHEITACQTIVHNHLLWKPSGAGSWWCLFRRYACGW